MNLAFSGFVQKMKNAESIFQLDVMNKFQIWLRKKKYEAEVCPQEMYIGYAMDIPKFNFGMSIAYL